MKYQKNGYWCGPASISAATRALGKPMAQAVAAKLGGCTPEGMDDVDIKRALLAYKFQIDICSRDLMLSARNWLLVALKMGRPVIMPINRWSHWVVILGLLGNRYIMFDPARYEYRINSGVTVYPWETLRKRWYANKRVRGTSKAYYAISVAPPLT